MSRTDEYMPPSGPVVNAGRETRPASRSLGSESLNLGGDAVDLVSNCVVEVLVPHVLADEVRIGEDPEPLFVLRSRELHLGDRTRRVHLRDEAHVGTVLVGEVERAGVRGSADVHGERPTGPRVGPV